MKCCDYGPYVLPPETDLFWVTICCQRYETFTLTSQTNEMGKLRRVFAPGKFSCLVKCLLVKLGVTLWSRTWLGSGLTRKRH